MSHPQLNSTSTQLQLNFYSTSCQPHFNLSLNINLNSTLTLTSTQYGCDIKATQSCLLYLYVKYGIYFQPKRGKVKLFEDCPEGAARGTTRGKVRIYRVQNLDFITSTNLTFICINDQNGITDSINNNGYKINFEKVL